MDETSSAPDGVPEWIEFNGILEGRSSDVLAIRSAARRLDHCGVGTFQCELTGGRYSLLPSETQVDGKAFDAEAQVRFSDAITAIVDLSLPGSVESTLRARLVYPTQVVEMLFVIRGGLLDVMSRTRPRDPNEAAVLRDSAAPRTPFGLGRRDIKLYLPMFLILAGLVFWQAGGIDRILAARAEEITVKTGPFSNMIVVKVERNWGNYELEIRRGPGYPKDSVALTESREATTSLVERAAIDVVGNGNEAWIQIRSRDNKVLGAVRVEFRELLMASDGVVKAKIHGRMGATSLEISLTRDDPDKK